MLAWGLLAGGCLSAWEVGGPWACSSDGTCAAGFTCDDGLCCLPGGAPACPSLPGPAGCPDGQAPQVYAEDLDGDGFGNPRVTALLCRKPISRPWVLGPATDCDDRDLAVHPGAVERCDARDDNCDGQLDEGLPGRRLFYRDVDGDGHGDASDSLLSCATPVGYLETSGDCAPYAASRHPGAPELCNGLDDDCDTLVDEAPLADSWNAGDAPDRFTCATGLPGVCAAGNQRCSGGARACQPQASPTVELCNGLDDSCDGAVDEQPACGGPVSLLSAPGLTYGAERLTGVGATTFNSVCPGSYAGAVAMSWASPTWSFSTPGATAAVHVFWVEAPAGQTWDLSGPGGALRLTFTATAPATGWGLASDFKNPVVFLCGEQPTQLMRYVKSAGALQGAVSSVDEQLPLTAGNGWVIGMGSGFDLSRVKRVEVMVVPAAPVGTGSYTVTFGPGTGFSK